MNKLIIIFLLFSLNTTAQNFDFIKSGLDTSALSHHIKSKYEVIVDSSGIDTVWKKRYDYLPNGYLKRYEEIDVKNLDTLGSWFLGCHSIEFKYNEKGFVIDKKERWEGPFNIGSTPDSSQITTNKIFKNNYLYKETTITTDWYAENESFTNTTVILYKPNSLILEIEFWPFYGKQLFKYDKNELLIRVENSNSKGIYSITEIMYVYF